MPEEVRRSFMKPFLLESPYDGDDVVVCGQLSDPLGIPVARKPHVSYRRVTIVIVAIMGAAVRLP